MANLFYLTFVSYLTLNLYYIEILNHYVSIFSSILSKLRLRSRIDYMIDLSSDIKYPQVSVKLPRVVEVMMS